MKRLDKILVLLLVLMMAISVFAACGAPAAQESKASESSSAVVESKTTADPSESASTAAPEKKKFTLGLSLPTQQNERWVRDGEGIQAKCDELGIDLKMQSANNDPNTQIKQCENLIAQGVDMLMVGPCDSKAAAPIVDKAHVAGIKVMSYCRLILDSDVDFFIGEDCYKVGEMQGQYLVENVPKGNYLILSGDPADNNAKVFYDGAMKHIKPLADKGDIKIVADQPVIGWDQQYAMKLVENALTANNNDIQAILCPADSTANGVVQALAAQGLDGKIPVTGQDGDLAAAQRIVKGTQAMTVFKDTRDLSALAVVTALAILNGEDVEPQTTMNNGKIDVPTWLTDPVLVTIDNLDKALIDSGYLTREEIYK